MYVCSREISTGQCDLEIDNRKRACNSDVTANVEAKEKEKSWCFQM
jgi:hypothetical protein